jgi:hypothetical protein
VHVFLLRADKRLRLADGVAPPWEAKASTKTIGNFFSIAVGPVVPFRHDGGSGMSRPYIHPRNIVPWKTIGRFTDRRRFSGRSFKPPFVVVKRTSRPEDSFRAIATIILGKELVAVENHLLVCVPNHGSITECRRLVKALKSKNVKVWFDNRIRCRHLTVGALSDCPLRLSA